MKTYVNFAADYFYIDENGGSGKFSPRVSVGV